MSLDGSQLSDLFNLYVLPAGRAAFAASRIATLARDGGHGRIEAAAGRVVEAATQLQGLELRWPLERDAPSPTHSPEALATDSAIDRTLSAIASTVQDVINGLEPTEPRVAVATSFLAAAFPTGVGPITRLSYEEELVAVQQLLVRLRGELAGDVATLAIGHYVERLEKLAASFATQLRPTRDTARLTFDKLAAARTELAELTASLVATIIGEFPGRSREHVTARVGLLAPLMAQNETIRRQRKRRNAVTDINPATGSEVDPGAPPQPPAAPSDSPPSLRTPEPVA